MSGSSDDAKERVREILLDHRGRDNPISSREINEMIDVDNVGSFPGTREIVRELCVEDGLPVAASTQGYYVIETENELKDYIDNLEGRILGMTERRYAVKRAADQWDGEIEEDDDLDLL